MIKEQFKVKHMQYKEPMEHTGMVGESVAQYARPHHFISQDELNRDYITIEESKARLKKVVYNHFHNS